MYRSALVQNKHLAQLAKVNHKGRIGARSTTFNLFSVLAKFEFYFQRFERVFLLLVYILSSYLYIP